MMSDYQVLARRYRPQRFSEVIGQDAVVTTLRNAICLKRTAHAYLFSGPRGTGKTTLARLFAKALNCKQNSDGEPCNECSSCKEITKGQALDVVEIDGASNRGIEEIRKINESVGFSASSGGYRIYIIDEVHMLTKEAFNALLKTLEEPPPSVKFFFATTEIHKVLPTIISRCQRFTLNRIPVDLIVRKLNLMTKDQKIIATPEALQLIADRADGGMRDAESLLDQIISFSDGQITETIVAEVLGVVSSETFFILDKAGKAGDLSAAFTITEQLFSQGKDLYHFVDSLLEHFRTILFCQVSGDTTFLSPSTVNAYLSSAKLYSQEQCLGIIDDLIQTQTQLRQIRSLRTALEALLLRILRSHSRVPVDFLVSKLSELEAMVDAPETLTPPINEEETPPPQPPATESPKAPIKQQQPIQPAPPPAEQLTYPPTEPQTPPPPILHSPPPPLEKTAPPKPVIKKTPPPVRTEIPQYQTDTILQFSAVELGGTLEKKQATKI